nr:unnamed protein product [Naegleria fowleri]
MYNGIGLPTPRGSGTNGYVQRNYSAISHRKEKRKDHRSSEKKDLSKIKTENQELRLHEEKKKVEIELFKLKSELTKKGELTPEEIENKIAEERKIRINRVEERFKSSNTDQSSNETSKELENNASPKHQKNEHLKKALKLDQHFKEHGIENDQDAQLVAFDSNVREMLLKRKKLEKSVTEKKRKRKKSEKKAKQSSSSSSSSSDSESSSSSSEEDN